MSLSLSTASNWSSLLSTAIVLPLLFLLRRSLPFAWHLRVLTPYLLARWKASASKGQANTTKGYPKLRLEALPIGKDPFNDTLIMDFKASIDDCDFMGHLSNSCYPKNLDIARSHYAAKSFLLFSADGGWIALGSVSFKFIKEIRVGSRYQIRSSIQAWDDKWLYLKNEFISKTKSNEEVLHCVSISKHCCKMGRKTIPPWFALAYCGYSPASSIDRLDNWNRSQALRLELQQKSKGSNPLKALIPVRGDEKPKEEWMSSRGWNVSGWQEKCEKNLQDLHSHY